MTLGHHVKHEHKYKVEVVGKVDLNMGVASGCPQLPVINRSLINFAGKILDFEISN